MDRPCCCARSCPNEPAYSFSFDNYLIFVCATHVADAQAAASKCGGRVEMTELDSAPTVKTCAQA